MPLIATLIHDRRVAESLRIAVASRVSLHCCDTDAQLRGLLYKRPPAAVIVDLGEDAFRAAAVVAAIRDRFRSLPVIGIVRWPTDARHIVPATRAGLTDILVLGHDNIFDSLQRVLEDSQCVSVVDAVLDVVGPRLPEEASSLVVHGLRLATYRATVEQLAFATRLSPKTLQRRTSRYGLGSPSELLAWCRILLAAQMLDDSANTVASVARELRFPSARAFRRTLRNLTRLRPSELRALGGLRFLVTRFVETARLAHSCETVDAAVLEGHSSSVA